MMRKEVQKKKVKGFAIDTFVQKGVCWSLAVFCGSVLVLGLLLRIIDALLFTQEEPSTCLWEVLFCGLATGALLLSTGPKIVKKSSKATPSAAPSSSRPVPVPDEEAQVAHVVRQLREAEFHSAEKEFLRLARHDLSSASTQSLIAACADVDVTRASGWLQVLRKNGRQISPKSLQLVVDALIKDVRMVEAEELVLKMLESPISVISGALAALFRQLELERIEELLLKLRQVGSRHWIFGLSVLLRTDRHISSIKDVEEWMQRAIDAKVPLEGNLFNSCITALARLGHPVLAEKWLKRMVCHVAPDPNSIATVISAYKAAKKRPVDNYPQRIKAKELHLDVSAFNQIIKSCIHLEDVDDAHRWLQLATEICDGPSLDSLWYSTVIGLSLRLGKAEIAERWIMFQVERGFTKDPSSFNAVITCHARQGTFQAAERLVHFMCEQGVEPDLVTLGAAVHSCARGNQPRKAEEMFQMIVKRGHTSPDVVAFNALIDAHVRAGDVQRAEEWLRQMLEAQVEASVVSYSSILHAYAKQGNIEAAEKVMQQMKEKKLEANVVTYTTLINACVKAGDIPRAEKFFELMQNAGIEANAMTYSSLLNVCAKAGDYQRAEVWLEKMCSSLVPTEVCFNNVIDACAKAGQAKRAEEWLWRLQGDVQGLSATRQSFTAAAQAYAKSGAFGDVERLFRAMEAQGISMDAFCLTVQLSSYARARPRQRERMEEALRKYQAQGLRITPPPLRVAKSVLGNSRLQQLMLELGIQAPRYDASDSW